MSTLRSKWTTPTASARPSVGCRLSAQGYDLIVSADEFDGARAGLFLRHLCARRFPGIPFLLLSGSGDGGGGISLSPRECRERIKRLL